MRGEQKGPQETKPSGQAHDVFISYKRERRETASSLAAALSLHGWAVWFDQQILEGEEWRNDILAALRNSRCVVVLWCADSVGSSFVRDEAARAQRIDALVPVHIEDIEPPLGFGEIQSVDLLGWKQGIDRLGPLIAAISRKIGPPGVPNRATILEQVDALELRRKRSPTIAQSTISRPDTTSAGPLANFRHAAKSPEMVWIRPGRFRMGSPEDERDRTTSEGPQRIVHLKRPFFMSRDPVTWGQWLWLYKQGNTDLHLPELESHASCPAVDVRWHDAVAYCERLSKLTGATYRLPSEAEWEYVCRSGQESAFAMGDTINPMQAIYRWETSYRNSSTEADRKSRPQSVDHPRNYVNAFGVRGMHGNVWEWVADGWWHTLAGAPANGAPRVARSDDSDRVVKGGSWASSAKHLRSAFRGRWNPDANFSPSSKAKQGSESEGIEKGRDRIGFRIVCEI